MIRRSVLAVMVFTMLVSTAFIAVAGIQDDSGEEANVLGKVVAEDGEPLEATVVFYDLEEDKEAMEVETGENGAFRLTLEPGKYVYAAEARGYYPAKKEFGLRENQTLELKIVMVGAGEKDDREWGVLSGQVMSLDDVPVPGAMVSLIPMNAPNHNCPEREGHDDDWRDEDKDERENGNNDNEWGDEEEWEDGGEEDYEEEEWDDEEGEENEYEGDRESRCGDCDNCEGEGKKEEEKEREEEKEKERKKEEEKDRDKEKDRERERDREKEGGKHNKDNPRGYNAKTDREGFFKLRAPLGPYMLMVRAPCHAPYRERLYLEPETRVEIWLEPFEPVHWDKVRVEYEYVDGDSDGNPEELWKAADLDGDGEWDLEYHYRDNNSDGNPESERWSLNIPREMLDLGFMLLLRFVKDKSNGPVIADMPEMPGMPGMDDCQYPPVSPDGKPTGSNGEPRPDNVQENGKHDERPGKEGKGEKNDKDGKISSGSEASDKSSSIASTVDDEGTLPLFGAALALLAVMVALAILLRRRK